MKTVLTEDKRFMLLQKWLEDNYGDATFKFLPIAQTGLVTDIRNEDLILVIDWETKELTIDESITLNVSGLFGYEPKAARKIIRNWFMQTYLPRHKDIK